jgi:hypothetical protein
MTALDKISPADAAPPVRERALRAGRLVARRVFAERGNHSEAHLSENELAQWIAVGCEVVLLNTERRELKPEDVTKGGRAQTT